MPHLDLLGFTPFRLNRLAAEFSDALAQDYRPFGIDIPEWRVLATLGSDAEPRPASFIVGSTRTHKSRISRAVGHLIELGLVERIESARDRREILLGLTAEGRRTYDELVPKLLAREATLLSGLAPAERAAFRELLGRLERSLELPSVGGE